MKLRTVVITFALFIYSSLSFPVTIRIEQGKYFPEKIDYELQSNIKFSYSLVLSSIRMTNSPNDRRGSSILLCNPSISVIDGGLYALLFPIDSQQQPLFMDSFQSAPIRLTLKSGVSAIQPESGQIMETEQVDSNLSPHQINILRKMEKLITSGKYAVCERGLFGVCATHIALYLLSSKMSSAVQHKSITVTNILEIADRFGVQHMFSCFDYFYINSSDESIVVTIVPFTEELFFLIHSDRIEVIDKHDFNEIIKVRSATTEWFGVKLPETQKKAKRKKRKQKEPVVMSSQEIIPYYLHSLHQYLIMKFIQLHVKNWNWYFPQDSGPIWRFPMRGADEFLPPSHDCSYIN